VKRRYAPQHQQRGDWNGKGKGKGPYKTPCLLPHDVEELVDAYDRIISAWNDADAVYLADEFRDTSDSINILAGIPLGSATFPTKDAFLYHMQTQARFALPLLFLSIHKISDESATS
jgi:hypothetical protein